MADEPLTPLPAIVTRKDAQAAGLKRYFTGVPCVRGHVVRRRVSDFKCMECDRLKTERRNRERPEKLKQYHENRREKYHSDPEVRRAAIERSKAYATANKKAVSDFHKSYYETNKEKMKAASRKNWAGRMADPEKAEKERARKREQHKKNPEAKRSYVRKRRAMIRGAEGKHNAKDIARLLEAQKHRCVYCPTDLRAEGYEVDHIVALSRGGSNWPSNLQILCKPCNRSKWCKDPLDFAKEKGRLL